MFIAMLAFEEAALIDAAKRAIIAASLLAGVAGAVILRMRPPLRDAK